MPDLITHTLFVYPLKKRFPKQIILLLSGAVLPDVVGRIPGILIQNNSLIGNYQTSVHTPIVLILLVYSLSFFFAEKVRREVFLFLLTGVFLHLFLDLFQRTNTYAYFWLFPFSLSWFQIPLIWPDETIFMIPVLVVINAVIYIFNKRVQVK